MKLIISIFLILVSLKAFAHQPKLIKYNPTKEIPHEVINPEISKAYYGKLNGEPHYYRIKSEKDFLFYYLFLLIGGSLFYSLYLFSAAVFVN